MSDPNGWVALGPGNTECNPCFVDPGYWDTNGTPDDLNDDFFVEGDYHLKSQAGRWDPTSESWVQDEVTSRCIDAGDPNSPVGYEPLPDGDRINMDAYGGTLEASKSTIPEPARSRSDRYQALLGSLIGTSSAAPMVRWENGCLHSLLAPPGTSFRVAEVDVNEPNAVAECFLETWWDLLMVPSGAADFEFTRLKSDRVVGFRQTYAGLEVFGAEIVVSVNVGEGVGSFISDIMTEATVLDARPDSVRPSLDAATARRLAEAHLEERHPHLAYTAWAPELMIYAPEVVGSGGEPRLIWFVVAYPPDGFYGYKLCLDAHTGAILLRVPLFHS